MYSNYTDTARLLELIKPKVTPPTASSQESPAEALKKHKLEICVIFLRFTEMTSSAGTVREESGIKY